MNVFNKLFESTEDHEYNMECCQFGNVTMKEDFGSLVKGLTYHIVSFNFDESECCAYNEEGNRTHQFNFHLTAS